MKFTTIALSLLSLVATATAAVVPVPEETDVTLLPGPTNATDIDEGILLPRAKCTLHVRWVKNWSEAGWRRYRVKAWAQTGGSHKNTKDMLNRWLYYAYIYDSGVFVGVNNFRHWFSGNNLAYIDLSFWEGSAGHKLYKEFHQVTVNDWRKWSKGCDVNSNF